MDVLVRRACDEEGLVEWKDELGELMERGRRSSTRASQPGEGIVTVW